MPSQLADDPEYRAEIRSVVRKILAAGQAGEGRRKFRRSIETKARLIVFAASVGAASFLIWL